MKTLSNFFIDGLMDKDGGGGSVFHGVPVPLASINVYDRDLEVGMKGLTDF